jgi:hypothetical protein
MINPIKQQAVARLQLQGASVSSPAYLTIDEVIERYRSQISEGTFRNWRLLRIGPSFIKIGKVPHYPVNELDRRDRTNLVVCRRSRTFRTNEAAIAKLEAPSFLTFRQNGVELLVTQRALSILSMTRRCRG